MCSWWVESYIPLLFCAGCIHSTADCPWAFAHNFLCTDSADQSQLVHLFWRCHICPILLAGGGLPVSKCQHVASGHTTRKETLAAFRSMLTELLLLPLLLQKLIDSLLCWSRVLSALVCIGCYVVRVPVQSTDYGSFCVDADVTPCVTLNKIACHVAQSLSLS